MSASQAPAAAAAAVLPLDRAALLALPPEERQPALAADLGRRAAAALGAALASLTGDRPWIALGLDSLAAVELAQEIETAYGVILAPAALLDGLGSTALARMLLAEMQSTGAAGAIGGAGHGDDGGGGTVVAAREAAGAEPGDHPEAFEPASHGQRGLWFLDRLAPGGTAYHLTAAARLRVEVEPARLRAALERLAARHEALRTTFTARGGEPLRRVAADPVAAFELIEHEAGECGDAELRERLAAALFRPFDLATGPLLRLHLFRRSGGERWLGLAVHHIAADFWSLGLLARELGAELAGGGATLAGGGAARVAAAPPYGAFVSWQRQRLAGAAGERLGRFWAETLRGLPDLALPTDRPRREAAGAGAPGASVAAALPPRLSGRLRELAGRQGTTLFAVLLAAFQALLARYTGQQDLAVGAPAALRPAGLPGVARIFGYLVNPLVLRADLDGAASFAELLGRTRRALLAALAHQDYPLPLLAERLRPELGERPLVRAMLVLHRPPAGLPDLASFALGEGGGRLRLGAVELESLPLPPRAAPFELNLACGERRGALGLALAYRADLLDAATARRLLEHFSTLLAGVAESPGLPPAALPLLTAGERHQLLLEWAAGSAVPPPWPSLHAACERQAARTPLATAIVAGAERLSYAELDRRASQLAARLRALGAGPERVVGICLPRTAELPVALLATLKTGAAYLPLDPAYPAERLALMLDDAGAELLVTREDLWANRATVSVQQVLLDRLPAAPGESRSGGPSLDPANLAYLIYTSGSTGRPKGVAITHGSAVRLLAWAAQAFAPGELAGVLAATSVGFDLSVFELFAPLAAGGTVVLADSVLDLPGLAAAAEVTLLNTVPSALAALLDLAPLPAGVRTVCLAGEPLPRALTERLHAVRPDVRLLNLYGPSEDTTYSTAARVTAGDPRPPAIGRPVAGSLAMVLDRDLAPLPAGVPGELCLGGGGVARGYLGRPELTAERFVPDPYHGRGARLYRTGDLARHRADGELEYLGRLDRQIKLRGFRIEPGEIEAALLAHPAVRDAVVLLRKDGDRARLVAYVTPAPAAALPAAAAPAGTAALPEQPTAVATVLQRACEVGGAPNLPEQPAADATALRRDDAVLRAHLRTHLPAALVPAVVVWLPELPLTRNGKVDRAALPAPPTAGAAEVARREPPRGRVEETLAEIWRELLGCEEVGREQQFFALGGHSLLVARLVSRVRERLGVDLPLRAAFAAPTLAGMAERIAALSPVPPPQMPMSPSAPEPPAEVPWQRPVAGAAPAAEGPATAAAVTPPDDRGGVVRARRDGRRLPLSSAQERLWVLDQMAPGQAAYNMPLALRLDGHLDAAALAASVQAAVRRHEILRTSFAVEDGRPWQRIASPDGAEQARAATLPRIDLAALPGARRQAEADRLARAEAARPFDLARGPLLRLRLIEMAGVVDRHLLVLVLHHAAGDFWSLGLLVHEIGALYGAHLAASGAGAPEPALQYADYAVWERQGAGPSPETLAYWRERLAGLAALELPLDRPRPAVWEPRGAMLAGALPAALQADLELLGRRHGATLFMTLAAGYLLLLRRLSGQSDLAVGTPSGLRERQELAGVIGCFVETLALRARVAAGGSFARLLAEVRDAVLGAYAHGDITFARLVEEVRPERDPSRPPLVQALFALQQLPSALALPRFAGLDAAAAPLPSGAAQLELSLALRATTAGLEGEIEYATRLFDAATVARLWRHLEALLAAAAGAPDAAAGELPLLAAAERHQLLVEWNDRPAEAAATGARDLMRRFAEQAAATPQATAVEAGARRLTYGQLASRVRRLARHLRRRGIGPEALVALEARRAPEMVIAVLAVLEAGGAYVPLDPAAPPERRAQVLAEAAPRLAIGWGGPPLAAYGCERLDLGGSGEDGDAGAGDDPDGAALDRDLPEHPVDGDQPAYVLFTSGSTGRPKGVIGSRRALSGYLAAAGESYALGPGDRLLQFAALGFDTSAEELLCGLPRGAALVLRDDAMLASSREFLAACARLRISVLDLPTAFWHELSAHLAGAPEALPPTLRLVIVGGEAMRRPAVASWLRQGGPRLINSYGPTEATIGATAVEIDAPRLAGWEHLAREVTVGRPVGAARAYVAAAALLPAPIGAYGELLLGGGGLARGYSRRPELTAERFVPDPWSGQPGARLYRTGDRARLRPDGEIEVLGRLDDQVKIRGYRVELGDIEAALVRHPGVGAAAVMLRPAPDGLVAYFTPAAAHPAAAPPPLPAAPTSDREAPAAATPAASSSSSSSSSSSGVAPSAAGLLPAPPPPADLAPPPSESELRRFLRRQLPEHMVPARCVALAELPVTSHGKVDRGRLPSPPAATAAPPAQPGEAPSGAPVGAAEDDPVRELVAGVWAAVLGRDAVGPEEDFFDLGGHSLLAAQVVARLSRLFAIELPLLALFEAPTVAALSSRVAAALAAQAGQQPPPSWDRNANPDPTQLQQPSTLPAAHAGTAPLSYSQERLWFLDQLNAGSPFYNLAGAVRLRGRLHAAALRASLGEVIRRHGALRTGFSQEGDEGVQVIAAELPAALPEVDLAALPPARRTAQAERLAAAWGRRPFDLARAPLLRVLLLRLERAGRGEEDGVLAIAVHHIVADGWSLALLTGELARGYARRVAGRPADRPDRPEPPQFADFARWQRSWLHGDVLAAQLEHWRGRLAGLAPTELPLDHPRPAVQTFRGAALAAALPAELVAALTALGRRRGATLFMTLLAAWDALLYRVTGRADVAIGTDVANRGRLESEAVVGFFVNSLVLRTDLSGNPSFLELLDRVRATALAAYAHQDAPFHRVVEALRPVRDPSRNPLFQLMFILQNLPPPALDLPGVALAAFPLPDTTAVFDLSVSWEEDGGGGLRGSLRYNSDLFAAASIRRLAASYAALLRDAAAHPETRLDALAIESATESERKTMESKKRKDLRFEKLAAARPQAVSLSPASLVSTGEISPGRTLPQLLQPAAPAVDAAAWAASHREELRAALSRHGGLLFRGFDVASLADFQRLIAAVAPSLIRYGERSSPRSRLEGEIYTSTDHPAEQPIVLHNEQSYTLNWPMKIAFFCMQPASERGATPLADSRAVYRRLSAPVREAFERRQVQYVRNYGDGLGLDWREVFQTGDRAEVERYCREAGIALEWKDGDRLRTRQVRPAIRRHPWTGEPVWFNHALFFHVSSLEPATREALLGGLAAGELPFHTLYGDGAEIEPAALAEVREAFAAETVSFPWQRGDVLLLDNMLVAHGREPFTGPRRIAVAMAEPFAEIAGRAADGGGTATAGEAG